VNDWSRVYSRFAPDAGMPVTPPKAEPPSGYVRWMTLTRTQAGATPPCHSVIGSAWHSSS